MTDTQTIRMYATRQQFKTKRGTETYGGHIFARSVAEAEQLCRSMGAQFGGEVMSDGEVFNEAGDDILDLENFENENL